MCKDGDDMMRERNNIYGQIKTPKGLEPVLEALRQVAGDTKGHIYKSGFNGAKTLDFSTEMVDFESTPLDDGIQHLVTGAVGGTLEDVTAFVRSFSAVLADLGIENSFEIYDDESNPVQLIRPTKQVRQKG